jgi:predicted DNA-binding protein (UPF0251 family)
VVPSQREGATNLLFNGKISLSIKIINMPRPEKLRKISFDPNVIYFKPRAVPLSELEEISLDMDELEALRLCDFEETNQTKAAEEMNISQSTLQRILSSGRKKVSEALVKGKAIKITK